MPISLLDADLQAKVWQVCMKILKVLRTTLKGKEPPVIFN